MKPIVPPARQGPIVSWLSCFFLLFLFCFGVCRRRLFYSSQLSTLVYMYVCMPCVLRLLKHLLLCFDSDGLDDAVLLLFPKAPLCEPLQQPTFCVHLLSLS